MDDILPEFLTNFEEVTTESSQKRRKQNDNNNEEDNKAKRLRVEKLLQPCIEESERITKLNNDESSIDAMTNSIIASSDDFLRYNQPSRIKIKQISSDNSYSHEVTIPPSIEFEELVAPSHPPLKEYKFQLDNFQKAAILCIENKQSVLISAHTSAGKTVIAEYVIAKALKDKQRVIYTTPIKALSNQKYREFSEEFPEVGLLTGDVTLAPNASVLIMTTEILQSMLYRGSSLIREVGWVIFDEIHYMRDRERGVVWEESIVLMPDNIRCAFLSATIPNARQFAEWISFLHNQVCHVVFTEFRPVPLQHYVFPCGGDGLLLVVDDKGNFLEANFRGAMRKLNQQSGDNRGNGNEDSSNTQAGSLTVSRSYKNESSVFKIVRLIMEHKLEPLIVFSFSKKECEIYATQLARLNFNTEKETRCVNEVFQNAMECLSEQDKELPQVMTILPLLRRGIGVHHGGLLPILKETVEILFGEGLLKCLFATETFAMGLNMPARTVLFTSARKYDGFEYRWISANEYIQMSGRAGRRGKDDRGTVILMVDENMRDSDARQIIQGKPDPLNSAFKITYNMLLNLMRVEGINPEYMIERSFFQFQNQAFVPEAEEKLKMLKEEYDKIKVDNEHLVSNYYKYKQNLHLAYRRRQEYIQKSHKTIKFFQPGRLVRITRDTDDFGWGVVVNFFKKQAERRGNNSKYQGESSRRASQDESTVYVLDCLLKVAPKVGTNESHSSASPSGCVKPAQNSGPYHAEVVSMRLKNVDDISAIRVMIPDDLMSEDNRMSCLVNVDKVLEKFEDLRTEMAKKNRSPDIKIDGLPLLDPLKDIEILNDGFDRCLDKIYLHEDKLKNHDLLKIENYQQLVKEYEHKQSKAEEIEKLVNEIRLKKTIVQMDDLKSRKRVLKRLNYCNDKEIIELKGRVACEITGADELVVTELLLKGIYNNLTPGQVAALTSCLVFEEKSSEFPFMDAVMSSAFKGLQKEARHLAEVTAECRLKINPDEYVDSFKPHMMDIVLKWSEGASFGQLLSKTCIFEGSIIRCIRLLEEVMRQLANAAKTIDNKVLEAKFIEAIRLVKRDIVFAASLYL